MRGWPPQIAVNQVRALYAIDEREDVVQRATSYIISCSYEYTAAIREHPIPFTSRTEIYHT